MAVGVEVDKSRCHTLDYSPGARIIPMSKEDQLLAAVLKAPLRERVFEAVARLDLPNCWVAGGFVRNAFWDDLYGTQVSSPINDVDVVYYKPLSEYGLPERELARSIKANEMNPVWQEESAAQIALKVAVPGLDFEVKNQARMHLSIMKTHRHAPYGSVNEALADWVETSTPVGIRKIQREQYEVLAPQGLDDLFDGVLRCTRKDYEPRLRERAQQKGWLTLWPRLRFEPCKE